MSARKLQLAVELDGERVKLVCPSVGTFSRAIGEGRALVAGECAGVLTTLGASYELVVPDGVAGMVVSARPERVLQPVDFGAVLYELAPLVAGAATVANAAASGESSGALVFRSPSAGRFWQRSAPTEPPLVSEGDLVETGKAVGLIEVMKTFTLVSYSSAGGLPPRAKVLRLLVADGAEVSDRTPLFELEAS